MKEKIFSFLIISFIVIFCFSLVGYGSQVVNRNLKPSVAITDMYDGVIEVGSFFTPLYNSVLTVVFDQDLLERNHRDIIVLIEETYNVEYVSPRDMKYKGTFLDYFFDNEKWEKWVAFRGAAQRAYYDDHIITEEQYYLIINSGKSSSVPVLTS